MPDEIPAEAMTRAEVGEVPVLAELRSTTPRQEETMRVLADVPHERVAGAVFITDGRVHDVPTDAATLGFAAPLHALITGRAA